MGVVSCGTTMIDAGAFVGLPSSGASWDTTAKTGSFTAVSGNGYFVNTTSSAITVTLPASPSAGDIVALQDYAGTWGTNNVTVARNGSDIGGIAADATLSVSNQSITLVYVDATRGWQTVSDSTQNIDGRSYIVATGGTISTCGDYKVHSFYGPGTFTVCSVGTTPANNVVDYLVVAGGGMGGHATTGQDGGGGGAGGYRESSGVATGNYAVSPLGACVSALPVTATGYPVTVGAGGIQDFNNSDQRNGACGSNSVFSSITSAGGGGGGAGLPSIQQAVPGGSGGGGNTGTAWPGYSLPQKRGCGNTPPVSPPQGNNGGVAKEFGTTGGAGGGGGAGAVGEDAVPSPQAPLSRAGNGGVGVGSEINGSIIMRSGGGGGGVNVGNYPQIQSGRGGTGGGGDGGRGGGPGQAGCGSEGKNAAINTGSGGGGNAGQSVFAGNGGSGIVIIRYKYK
jgi:hypothetical protein